MEMSKTTSGMKRSLNANKGIKDMTKPLSEDLRSLVLTDDWKSPIPHSSNLKDEIHFKWSLEAA